ncbi:unnamed protein product [Urochloa decumbens]|uniref:GRF-type domain-containing protein n=1 Tax=Urochloa decumbens TaxID=240449 RepID=A0ABC8ZRX4_9POAL
MEAPSSSSVASRRRRSDLPLIACTDCKTRTVLELETKTDENGNRGRIFYKCPNRKRDGTGCGFWYWEEDYVDFLKTPKGKIAIEQLYLKESLEVNNGDMKEGKKQNKEKEELELYELAKQMRLLVAIGTEIVTLLKCILVVCVCGFLWNSFVVSRRNS